MRDLGLNEITTKKICYQYRYQYFDNIGESIDSYIIETEHNSTQDILIEKTQDITNDIAHQYTYTYTYDNQLNLLEKKRNGDDMDIYIHETVYHYENSYDDEGKLIQVIESRDGRWIGTTKFTYSDDRLVQKESVYNNGDHEAIDYIYNDQGTLYEEIILKNGELSHYYQYSILEDSRIKKTLLSPARGKYHWELTYSFNDEICTIDIHDPILTVDMIKEIMDYVVEKYGKMINCVLFNTSNISLLYKYEDEQIYKYYEEEYEITILEFF